MPDLHTILHICLIWLLINAFVVVALCRPDDRRDMPEGFGV